MSNICLITSTGIKNNLRSKIVLIVYIIVLLICASAVVVSISILAIQPELDKEQPDKLILERYLGVIVYSTSLITIGIYFNSFAFKSLTREKSRGIIASLLAAPLTAKDIWLGKSLAIFIPALIFGEAFTLIVLIILNYIYFIPGTGFLINPWIALSSFLAAPLIYFCLSLMTHLIGLTGKPASADVIANIFLPVIVSLSINLAMQNILDVNSWSFTAANLGIAAIIFIITIPLLRRLTNENIVLSG